jgi:hypothetical protein
MQMVKKSYQILEMAVLTVDRFAPPVAAKVVAENAEARCIMGEFVIPLTAIRHAGMDHDERLAIARDLKVDASLVDVCIAGLTSGLRHCIPHHDTAEQENLAASGFATAGRPGKKHPRGGAYRRRGRVSLHSTLAWRAEQGSV